MRKYIVYLAVISSLLGASVVSIDLGMFQLSLFRALIILISMIMFIDMLFSNKLLSVGKKENSYSIKFMLIWFLYAFFTLAWVKDYISWVKAIYFLGLGLFCVVIFSKYLKTKFDILTAFRLMVVMIIFHNIIGWYEVDTGNYLFLSVERVTKFARYKYPVSMFGNTNDFATFMLFSVFITYICAMNTKRFIAKLLYLITMLSSVSLLIMSGSRANILGLILGLGVFVFLSIQNKKTRRALLIVLLSLFMILLFNPELITNLLYTIDEQLYFRFSEQGSDLTRLNLIKNGFIFLFETCGFGTGAGNIEYWMANYGVYYTGTIENIHNWWMEILTGYGIVIFIMYIVFYVKLFLSAYKKFKTSEDKVDISISLGIMCCMAGYIVGSISSSSNISSEWLWVFWGIAIAYQGVSGIDNKAAITFRRY